MVGIYNKEKWVEKGEWIARKAGKWIEKVEDIQEGGEVGRGKLRDR